MLVYLNFKYPLSPVGGSKRDHIITHKSQAFFVIPAQAGIQARRARCAHVRWVPACAGMTGFSFSNLYHLSVMM
ncbi:hypothetical protein C2L89_02110 [Coxiella burnetii]|nr:hypothetical protein C2L89_02110 [Coxiella burnetii]